MGWTQNLSDVDQRHIRELIADATSTDGIAPVGDQVLRALSHDRTRHLLAVADGVTQGYLNLAPAGEEPAMAELVVRPD
ncbi:mycothiol synthase, partial [Mycobacterium sp. ITM-2017-0098]